MLDDLSELARHFSNAAALAVLEGAAQPFGGRCVVRHCCSPVLYKVQLARSCTTYKRRLLGDCGKPRELVHLGAQFSALGLWLLALLSLGLDVRLERELDVRALAGEAA